MNTLFLNKNIIVKMKSLIQLIKESIIDESCNTSQVNSNNDNKIARINSKTGYYKDINESNVPYENLNTADEVITYAKTLSDFTFKDEESGFGKKGLKAFSLTNKNGLKIIVDFFDDSEYVYDIEDKDGNSLYRMPSTRINHETNWKDKLNPKTWSRKMISATESRISKYNANAKRAKNRYDHFGKTSDYNKYLEEKTWAQRESRSLEKIKKIAELS